MIEKFINFLTFKSWLNKGKQHFAFSFIFIWLNILTIVILSLLSIYARIKSKGNNIESLFSDPFDISIFYLGWFTSISETMWCAAISISLFTAALLPKSSRQFKVFLIVSALVMSLLYFDDRFRLTLILCVFFGTYKIVKMTVYLIYGLLLVFYAWTFRSIIQRTPYISLLIAFFLFSFSSAVDITLINNGGIHAMLEDGTKLIGLVNLAVYFWYICQQEIKKNIVQRP